MIDSFKGGDYDFLSNFHYVPVYLEGFLYRSVEHAYVAAKTEDIELRKQIAVCSSPGLVKKMGRSLTLRRDWDSIRIPVMRGLIRQKFSPFDHHDLAMKLIETFPHELVEGNWWGDKFWGVCKGEGENNLGKLLMNRRSKLLALRYEYNGDNL